MAKSKKATPAPAPAEPEAAASPAPALKVTRTLDLDAAARAAPVWSPRVVKPRPTPAPFDYERCRERLLKLKKHSYAGWLEWGPANIAPVLTPKEAHFWFLALTTDTDKPDAEAVASTISEKAVTGVIDAETVLARIRGVKAYFPGIVQKLLFNLFDPVAVVELMQNEAVIGSNQQTTYAADSFAEHVLAYLDDAELAKVRDALRPHLDPAHWPHQLGAKPPTAFFTAAHARMPDELLAVVRSIPDDTYRGNNHWYAVYHEPLRLTFALGTPQLVEAETRRLGLKFESAADVEAWLALTEFAALDYARDQILSADRFEGDRMLRAFAQANAPEVAPLMLELKLNAKSPGRARQWLADNSANAIAGLVPAAAGRGKVAEAAVDYLREMKRKGHEAFIRSVVDAAEPAVAEAVRKNVLDYAEKEYPLLAGSATPDELKGEFANAKAKKSPKPPAWVTSAALPPILLNDMRLDDEQVAAVLGALQRSAPDKPDPLAVALRKHADRASLDAFAWKLFQLWQGEGNPPKEKWMMGAIGAIGGDGCALKLTPLVRNWPGESQHQRAVFGLMCLRGIGSDTALMQLNGISQKLKFKGLKQKAAEAMEAIAKEKGLTRAQLEDRVVPDCDLDERGQRVFDFGPRQFRFALGADMKPMVKDADGKVKADLPKPGKSDDATKAAEAVAAWKLMKKQIKEVVALQSTRLEQAMVTGRRWPLADFDALLVKHPLMIHLVRRLVWGVYDASGKLAHTFRVTEDQTLADAKDAAFQPKAGEVGVVHPLHLSDAEKAAWGAVFGDYEIVPPFAQLGRAVFRVEPKEAGDLELKRFSGVELPAPTLVFGLENRGWLRGGAGDGGSFNAHVKQFPTAGMTAIVHYDGGVGYGYIDPNSVLTVEGCYFVVGLTTYSWNAKRLELGQVDAVVLSEVTNDLAALAAKAK
jgi:hypothetical protein